VKPFLNSFGVIHTNQSARAGTKLAATIPLLRNLVNKNMPAQTFENE